MLFPSPISYMYVVDDSDVPLLYVEQGAKSEASITFLRYGTTCVYLDTLGRTVLALHWGSSFPAFAKKPKQKDECKAKCVEKCHFQYDSRGITAKGRWCMDSATEQENVKHYKAIYDLRYTRHNCMLINYRTPNCSFLASSNIIDSK